MNEQEEVKMLRDIEIMPIHLTLSKNTKGYNWEISVRAKSLDEALVLINDANVKLEATYGRL